MLLCSHEFGRRQYAEGICTWRLAAALAGQGCRLRVATSLGAEAGLEEPSLEVLRLPEKPGTIRVSMWLWRYLGLFLEPGWTWRLRVARLPVGPEKLVYGRCMPLSSLLAAAALARRHRKPLGIHFSDPYPGVWDAKDRWYRARLRCAKRLLERADFVTFVTEQARRWVAREHGMDLGAKSFLVPHVGPPPLTLGPSASSPSVFLYAGRFYGRRRPDRLFQGFRLLLRDRPGVEFHTVGAEPDSVLPAAAQAGIASAVRSFPFALDLRESLAGARVLIATDADDRPAVFLTTKLIEYLNTDRLVLLVSPEDSPGAALVRRFPGTARRVTEEPEAIRQGMRELLALRPRPEDFAERQREMEAFSGPSVAKRFLQEIQARTTSPVPPQRSRTAPGGGHDESLSNSLRSGTRRTEA